MKKLNLFAVGLIAMLAASSVNAEVVKDATIKNCLANSSTDVTECKLDEDINISSADFNVVGTKTIDLNGHTLTMNNKALVIEGNITITNGKLVANTGNTDYRVLEVKEGATLTTKDVEIETPTDSFSGSNGAKGAIYVLAGVTNSAKKTIVNIEEGTKVSAYAGLIIAPADYADAGTSSQKKAYNVEVNLNGGEFKTTQYAVHAQGLIQTGSNVNVNVKGGNYESTGAVALYAAGVSNWTIESGVSVKGLDALQVKGGNVVINGGTFLAVGTNSYTGTAHADVEHAAVSLLDDAGYADNAKLVINDGTFISEEGSAFVIDLPDSTSNTKVQPEINGGYFETKKANANTVDVKGTSATSYTGKFINGGIYKSATAKKENITKYLSTEKHSATDANGNTVVGVSYTVTVKSLNVVSGVSGYQKPESFTAIAGERVNLKTKLNVTGSPSDRNYQYAVKYILNPVSKAKAVTGTVTGLDEFTMPESDVELILEIVEVKIDDYKAGEDVTPSTPGTDPTPGEPTDPSDPERDPEAGEKDPSEELPNNQPTGDNVMGSVAMGIAGLVGIVGSALVFDKKTNYNN